MPGADGFKLYEEMHAIDPNIRFLFISGDHSHFNEQKLKHIEISSIHYLDKPTSLRTLVERVKAILAAE